MSGGNVFNPDAPDLRNRLTGIALNLKVWNTGAPCVATDWTLAVIAQGKPSQWATDQNTGALEFKRPHQQRCCPRIRRP